MSGLSFGSFEEILRSYITPKITKQELANILLLSPEIDVRKDEEKLRRDSISIEKSVVTKICSGERGLPRKIRKYYSAPNAFEYVKLCFATDIVPRIPNNARGSFLQEIFALIKNDEELSAERKEYLVQCVKEECLGDFLSEVYLCAIRPKSDEDRRSKNLPSQKSDSITVASMPSQVSSAPNWGDNIKYRPFYTLEEIDAGALDGIFAFNSIRNSTIGDEKNFVGVRENVGVNAGRNNVWNISEVKVEHDAEYIVRLYVHGSNKYGTDSIASNVKVAFNIPTETGRRIKITGFLYANNAHPNKYWSSVDFVSDIPFHLCYIYGSALIENNGVGKNGGRQLSDEIVTKANSNNGTLIGYDQLDGRLPTSYQYASYITIRVKAVFDVPFLIDRKVRLTGSVDWEQSAKVKVGATLEFYFKYKNISDCKQNDVMIQCILPPNLRYIPGSTKIYNAKYNGAVLSDGITTKGVNLGNYIPGSDVLVQYTSEVVDDNLADGQNTLVIWVKCSVGELTRQESISIIVRK